MALYSIVPRPAASATAAPLIPEKIMLTTTLTCPRPPGSGPTASSAKSKMSDVIPMAFIIRPANRKNGMARSVNEFIPEYIRWAITCALNGGPIGITITTTALSPIAYATGTPSTYSARRTRMNAAVSVSISATVSLPLHVKCSCFLVGASGATSFAVIGARRTAT